MNLAEKLISLSKHSNLVPKVAQKHEMDRKSQRDILRRVPSIDKAKRLLRFEPQVSLDEGLKKVLAHFGAQSSS